MSGERELSAAFTRQYWQTVREQLVAIGLSATDAVTAVKAYKGYMRPAGWTVYNDEPAESAACAKRYWQRLSRRVATQALTNRPNLLLALIGAGTVKADVPAFQVGDTVIIHQKLLDGAKERIQTYEGDVIARSGTGPREMITVRKIVQGEGVERIFLIHSPRIARIEVKKAGKVRRAKLYYIRERVGKAVKIKTDTKPRAKRNFISGQLVGKVLKAKPPNKVVKISEQHQVENRI